MITIGLLVWVGVQLNAPALFYVLLGISAMFKLLSWYYILLGIVAVAKIFKMIGND